MLGRVLGVKLRLANTALTTDPRTRHHYQLASTTRYEPSLYRIAVPKDEPQLRTTVERALDQVIHSGEYGEIMHRWNVADGAVLAAPINAGATAPAP